MNRLDKSLRPPRSFFVNEFSEYLATGSSRKQLLAVFQMIQATEVSPTERAYLNTEAIPRLRIFFESAVKARKSHFFSTGQVAWISAFVAISSMASATELVATDRKWVALLASGIFITIRAAIEVHLQIRQPALDWLVARTAYDMGLGEVINRLTRVGVYANLPEDKAFILMASRIDVAFGNSEKRIQNKINEFLGGLPIQDGKEDDEPPPPPRCNGTVQGCFHRDKFILPPSSALLLGAEEEGKEEEYEREEVSR